MNIPFNTKNACLLLTDIEGSTRLWEKYPQEMSLTLARHDALTRQLVQEHTGTIYRTAGDSFWLIFADAEAALNAAVAMQRAFWNGFDLGIGQERLKVRMALYLAEGAADSDSEEFELALRWGVALLGAAHGGQILLTESVQQQVEEKLDWQIGLRDFGSRVLKGGLIKKEHIYQLTIHDLPNDFAPIRTEDAHEDNLPAAVTSFIGRKDEIEYIQELVREPTIRLVTLIGPGGTGKTRLSLQVARGLLDEFEHGVFFVRLESLTSPALFISELAQTLAIKEKGSLSLLQIIKNWLAEKRLLLVMDNFEQIVSAAPVLAEIVEAAPYMQVLASSRIALGIENEYVVEVAPLSLPSREEINTGNLESLRRFDAVALFAQRANSIQKDFSLSDENVKDVARLCSRLDGLPLAIELAAMRIRQFKPEQMVEQLNRGLEFLNKGPVNWTDRQRTLRGAIEWSYNLLEPEEKRIFRQLAVFANSWSFAAARFVTGCEDVAASLESLTAKSLIRHLESNHEQAPSCYMLQTIREYGLEQLAATEELDQTRQKHADYYLDLARQAEPHLKTEQQMIWLNLLEAEHNNLRLALEYLTEQSDADSTEKALLMAGTLRRFWEKHCYFSEGRHWLETILNQPHSQNTQVTTRALALVGAGVLAWRQADLNLAKVHLQEGVKLYRQLDDPEGLSIALNNLGVIALHQANYDEASLLFEENLMLVSYLDNDQMFSSILNNLGVVSLYRNAYDRARSCFEQVLELKKKLKDRFGIAGSLQNLATALLGLKDYAQARLLFSQSLELYEEMGNKAGIAETLEGLASTYINGPHEDLVLGVRYFAAMEALREEMGAPHTPAEKQFYEPALTELRRKLGSIFYDAFWEEGRSLKLADVLHLAKSRVYYIPDNQSETVTVNEGVGFFNNDTSISIRL